jgi:hypothetical protein
MAEHHDYAAMSDAITGPIVTGPQGIGKFISYKGNKVLFLKDGVTVAYTMNPAYKQQIIKDIHLFKEPGLRMRRELFVETNGRINTGTMVHTKTTKNPNLFGSEPEEKHLSDKAKMGSIESIDDRELGK